MPKEKKKKKKKKKKGHSLQPAVDKGIHIFDDRNVQRKDN
jgi:hypothetical protein